MATTDTTVGQLAEALRISPDTMRKRIVRAADIRPDLFADTSAASDRILSVEQVAVLSRRDRTKSKVEKPKTKQEVRIVVRKEPAPAPQTPEPARKKQPPKKGKFKMPSLGQVRQFAMKAILIGVVLCHAALIWYDCAQLWGVAGQIGGGAVFLIVLAAVLLAADSERYATSEAALYFVFFVDVAAWWVHMPVFRTPLVSDEITGTLCGFLCACSWVALYLFRSSSLD